MTGQTVSIEELLISSLATNDGLAKPLIEKGIVTQEEFLAKVAEEQAAYHRRLKSTPTQIGTKFFRRAAHGCSGLKKRSSSSRFDLRLLGFFPCCSQIQDRRGSHHTTDSTPTGDAKLPLNARMCA